MTLVWAFGFVDDVFVVNVVVVSGILVVVAEVVGDGFVVVNVVVVVGGFVGVNFVVVVGGFVVVNFVVVEVVGLVIGGVGEPPFKKTQKFQRKYQLHYKIAF